MARKLSVLVPAYNEERFIEPLLRQVLAVDVSKLGLTMEVVVVDDGSKDRTAELAASVPGIVLHRHPENRGKGAAVRTAFAASSGDLVMIQDADLEYDPQDYLPMLAALDERGCDAVYGSRYLRRPGKGVLANLLAGRHPGQSLPAYLGGQSLSFVALAMTGRYLTDTVTALKLFRRDVLDGVELVTRGFELDHEITARILARGRTIVEVPVGYRPRSKEEGKKIGLRDWWIGSRTYWRFRKG